MKKIFFDCGCHHGMGLKFYRKIFSMDKNWEVHAFEPNPSNAVFFAPGNPGYSENVNFHQSAVSVEDGEADFFMEDHSASRSGSPELLNVKTDGWGSTMCKTSLHSGLMQPVKVNTVDFSRLVGECQPGDFVIVKMDIEGAEYDVLRKMIKDNTIQKISVLFVEFHFHNHAPQESYTSTQALIDEIEKLGVPVILESFDMEKMAQICN